MNTLRPFGTLPVVSSLTADPVLKSIFRQIEDDGAAEVLPTFSPRKPSPAAQELVEELV